MPAKIHHVLLTQEQREQAEIVARSYKHKEAQRKRAKILLLADAKHPDGGHDDQTIHAQVHVSRATVENVRQRFVEGGLKAALERKEQTQRKARVLDGEAEAFLIATVCSVPPEGRGRWTLHLLADKLVVAGYVDAVSHETVRQTLKKTNSSRG
jgi:transposase